MSSIWKCPECGRTSEWSYAGLAEFGTPICDRCDDAMELVAEAADDQVFIRFECGQEDRISREYGPFPFVQLTYDQLRVGPNGDVFAHIDGADGCWHIVGEKGKWSDVYICPRRSVGQKDKSGAEDNTIVFDPKNGRYPVFRKKRKPISAARKGRQEK